MFKYKLWLKVVSLHVQTVLEFYSLQELRENPHPVQKHVTWNLDGTKSLICR